MANENEQVINYAEALSRLGGDRELFRDMARFFRDDAPGLMQNIESGIKQNDPPSVTIAAHTLKNMAATCGGELAAKIAGKVESSGRRGDLGQAAQLLDELHSSVDAFNKALLDAERATPET